MKKIALLLSIFISYMTNSYGSAPAPEEALLPDTVKEEIAKENEMTVKSIHAFPKGTLKWGDSYISAIVFEDSIKNCSIYIFANDSLSPLFNGAPCEFKGGGEINFSRASAAPDILYRVKLFLPNRGAMVDNLIAFYFDSEKKTYCESQSLASWYETGNKTMKPDLSDGKCTAE
ncbi:hypothetical protein [Pseudomonas sp. MWU13-2100]|uniref:hypothetical protein n=1 Tax=Pseudomonas sp. MWU13-2100 TaxID=2935075 RepID=UPI00200EC76D|nr:hypothetical protein [Pseudomonas sp. MWU13-2100]